MDPVFSIGISSLWDELRHMPAGGVWWFNVDRHEDAISLANQTIASQAETAHVAVISMDSDPAKIFQLDDSQGPGKITLFSMLNHEKGLYYLARDLQCSIDPHNYLFILVCANNAWQNIPAERLRSWLDKMNKWSRLNHCSLLVINSEIITINNFHCYLRNTVHFLVLPVCVFRATNICWILLSGATKKGSAPVSSLAFSNKMVAGH